MSVLVHGAALVATWHDSAGTRAPAPRLVLRLITMPTPAAATQARALDAKAMDAAPAVPARRSVRSEPRRAPAPAPAKAIAVAAPSAEPPAPAPAPAPVSGAVFALPRFAFAAGAAPVGWMRRPSVPPNAEAAPRQALAAHQQAACAEQAALHLQCELDTPDAPNESR